MTLGAGSLCLQRFVIATHTPKQLTPAWIYERLNTKLIRPLHIDDTSEQAIGWCHPFSGEPSLEPFDKLIFDNFLVFGMRIDTKKVPGTLFRLQMKMALDSLAKELGEATLEKNRSLHAKKIRDAARERIKLELLKHMLPSIRLMEVVWNLDNQELWLTTTSKTLTDAFLEIFQETFNLPLMPLNAGSLAAYVTHAMDHQDLHNFDNLLNLKPVEFIEDSQ